MTENDEKIIKEIVSENWEYQPTGVSNEKN